MKKVNKHEEEGKSFDHKAIQTKWDLRWARDGIYEPDLECAKNPFYNLMMFPYPSAEGLHVGNMYAFCGSDIYGRFMRMRGMDVFEPIGLDGFGIHSENYALKVGEHPMKLAERTEANFYRQLHMIGNGYAWGSKLETYRSNYYKWTQYIFTLMFKSGLAYRDTAKVNWCPSCLTVLSDEQVVNKSKRVKELKSERVKELKSEREEVIGFVCERCGTEVVKRELTQWFFRITEYAGRLLEGLEKIDWSEKVKLAQKNWIGKSRGARIRFKTDINGAVVEVFTTRPDTIYGATFLVLAPEHPLVTEIIKGSKGLLEKEVRDYVGRSIRKTEVERQGVGEKGARQAKSGVRTTYFAINPLTKKPIPVFIADYVLTSYGTGAVMGVPAHDQRDWVFAGKYHIDIVPVIKGGDVSREAFTGSGRLINSEGFNGLDSSKAINTIIKYIQEHHLGFQETRWHLRDWIISRQRYWGPPIPMIFCENCANEEKSWFTEEGAKGAKGTKGTGILNFKFEILNSARGMRGWYPVPDDDLPVELPYVENFKPTGSGVSPLAAMPSFVNAKCPHCGKRAKRETDVSDTFLDSAWYYLRYPSVGISNAKLQMSNKGIKSSKLEIPWDSEITKKWLPVDMYIGGAEHAVLHLLYSRFLNMALYDLGLVGFEEPFTKFRTNGLLIKDGAKMSKSKGNVVNPDTYVEKYGADTLRTYLMFCGRFMEGGDFRDTGIEGMGKFLRRIYRLVGSWEGGKVGENGSSPTNLQPHNPNDLYMMHKTIKKVTGDISTLNYNTAISAIMEWVNFLGEKVAGPVSSFLPASARSSQKSNGTHKDNVELRAAGNPSTAATPGFSRTEVENLILLLAPFAPYLCEELWSVIGNNFSVHTSPWPEFDEKLATASEVVLVVQVNGKVRDTVTVGRGVPQEEAEKLALDSIKVKKFLVGKKPKKVVFVADKLINFVT